MMNNTSNEQLQQTQTRKDPNPIIIEQSNEPLLFCKDSTIINCQKYTTLTTTTATNIASHLKNNTKPETSLCHQLNTKQLHPSKKDTKIVSENHLEYETTLNEWLQLHARINEAFNRLPQLVSFIRDQQPFPESKLGESGLTDFQIVEYLTEFCFIFEFNSDTIDGERMISFRPPALELLKDDIQTLTAAPADGIRVPLTADRILSVMEELSAVMKRLNKRQKKVIEIYWNKIHRVREILKQAKKENRHIEQDSEELQSYNDLICTNTDKIAQLIEEIGDEEDNDDDDDGELLLKVAVNENAIDLTISDCETSPHFTFATANITPISLPNPKCTSDEDSVILEKENPNELPAVLEKAISTEASTEEPQESSIPSEILASEAPTRKDSDNSSKKLTPNNDTISSETLTAESDDNLSSTRSSSDIEMLTSLGDCPKSTERQNTMVSDKRLPVEAAIPGYNELNNTATVSTTIDDTRRKLSETMPSELLAAPPTAAASSAPNWTDPSTLAVASLPSTIPEKSVNATHTHNNEFILEASGADETTPVSDTTISAATSSSFLDSQPVPICRKCSETCYNLLSCRIHPSEQRLELIERDQNSRGSLDFCGRKNSLMDSLQEVNQRDNTRNENSREKLLERSKGPFKENSSMQKNSSWNKAHCETLKCLKRSRYEKFLNISSDERELIRQVKRLKKDEKRLDYERLSRLAALREHCIQYEIQAARRNLEKLKSEADLADIEKKKREIELKRSQVEVSILQAQADLQIKEQQKLAMENDFLRRELIRRKRDAELQQELFEWKTKIKKAEIRKLKNKFEENQILNDINSNNSSQEENEEGGTDSDESRQRISKRITRKRKKWEETSLNTGNQVFTGNQRKRKVQAATKSEALKHIRRGKKLKKIVSVSESSQNPEEVE